MLSFNELSDKILKYLKSRPVEGRNENTIYTNLSKELSIEKKEVQKIIGILLRRGKIFRATFTSYSPFTKSSRSGVRFSIVKQISLRKKAKQGSHQKRVIQERVHTPKFVPTPSVKDAERIFPVGIPPKSDKTNTKTEGRHHRLPRAHQKRKTRIQEARKAELL